MKRFMGTRITVLVLLAVMTTGYAETFVTAETDVANMALCIRGSVLS